jgi:hypothetical protein
MNRFSEDSELRFIRLCGEQTHHNDGINALASYNQHNPVAAIGTVHIGGVNMRDVITSPSTSDPSTFISRVSLRSLLVDRAAFAPDWGQSFPVLEHAVSIYYTIELCGRSKGIRPA